MEVTDKLESSLHEIILQAENLYFRGVETSTKKIVAYSSKYQYLL